MPPRRVVSRSSGTSTPTPSDAQLPAPTTTATPTTVPEVAALKSAALNASSSRSGNASNSSAPAGADDQSILITISNLWDSYLINTTKPLKLLDTFQLFLMLTGIAQFLYCILITNYPFNAFLGGFSATVGQFVLAASMRAQVNPANKGVFPTISPERAFGDFVFCSLILHFFVYNYLG